MEISMKRFSVATATVLVALSSSIASGLVLHGRWTGMVMGKDNSKIHGTATMKSGKNNTTEVVVKLKGDTPSTTRPWHIHVGSCTSAGAPLGGGKPYTPMVGNAKGAAQGKATLALPLPDTGSYYVNIHESSANMGKIVACGDLKADK